ncbi:hypothetical protein PFISCL1PPCAC_20772, partial [Pristionchus fissidentatus]
FFYLRSFIEAKMLHSIVGSRDYHQRTWPIPRNNTYFEVGTACGYQNKRSACSSEGFRECAHRHSSSTGNDRPRHRNQRNSSGGTGR